MNQTLIKKLTQELSPYAKLKNGENHPKQEKVKEICLEYIATLKSKYIKKNRSTGKVILDDSGNTIPMINTIYTNFTAARKAIRENFGENHIALTFINFSKKELQERENRIAQNLSERHSNVKEFNKSLLLEKAKEFLNSDKASALTAGFIICTACRYEEIFTKTKFSKKDNQTLYAQGLAKQSQQDQKKTFEIKCLEDTDLLLSALDRIRKDIEQRTQEKARETNTKPSKELREKVSHAKKSTTNSFIKNNLKTILEKPNPENKKYGSLPTLDTLRAAYSTMIIDQNKSSSTKTELKERSEALRHSENSKQKATQHYQDVKVKNTLSLTIAESIQIKLSEIKKFLGLKENNYEVDLLEKEITKSYKLLQEFQKLTPETKYKNRKKYSFFIAIEQIKKRIQQNEEANHISERKPIEIKSLRFCEAFKEKYQFHEDVLYTAIKALSPLIEKHHKKFDIRTKDNEKIIKKNHDIYTRSYENIYNYLIETDQAQLEKKTIDEEFFYLNTRLKDKKEIDTFYDKYPSLKVEIREHNLWVKQNTAKQTD